MDLIFFYFYDKIKLEFYFENSDFSMLNQLISAFKKFINSIEVELTSCNIAR